MTPGLSARISATRLSHIGSSDNPPWPSAILWISSGPRRLVNETLTCATCDCADALNAAGTVRLSNSQSLASGMEGDNALSRRRLQPMNTALRRRQMSVPYYYLAESSHDGQLFPRRPRLVLLPAWMSCADYQGEADT